LQPPGGKKKKGGNKKDGVKDLLVSTEGTAAPKELPNHVLFP